jgi:hypothetical protein
MESDFIGGQPTPEAPKSNMVRDAERPVESRAALVKAWADKVTRAKKHWSKAHARMKEDQDFYMGKQWGAGHDDSYVANLIQRHIGQRVSALYAKNPKFVAKRRKTMDFTVWNGDMAAFQNAQTSMMNAASTGQPIDPVMIQLMQDVQQGMEKRRMLDKVAETMEIVAHHQIHEQQPSFKTQMKQAVRRACVTGVSFLKIGYHRVMQKRPEDVEKITDITEQMATLQRLVADRQDNKFGPDDARMEQLRRMLEELQSKTDVIVREGIKFDFPLSHTIIPDTKCRQLNGFVGADWVAQEYVLDIDEVKEIYGVDLGKEFQEYKDAKGDEDDKRATVWEIYSKKDGLVYVIADGYHDFLKQPECPVLELERFWPFFALVFNEVESERDIYPASDVRLLMPIQREYNRAREGLRQHRQANKPKYATYNGALDEKDVANLTSAEAHQVIKLNNLSPGQDIKQILQPIQHAPIDPSLYDTSMLLDDMMRVGGSQEANLGATGASTATEVSVAEGSRMSAMSSNIDDLEDFLSELARSTGEALLLQMDEVTVKKIAGPGAVWPQLTANEIAQELMLEVEAGSNGRPNKGLEVSNLERLAPIMLQIPGLSPEWLLKQTIRRLDDSLDPSDAIQAALPSIIAQNSIKTLGAGPAGISTGDPATDPAQQGQAGSLNTEMPTVAPGTAGPTPPPSPGDIRAGNIPTP